jgi:hypothetical protein
VLRQYSIYDGTIQTFLKGLDIHSDNGVDVIASADTIGVSVLLLLRPPITDRISLFRRLLNFLHLLSLPSSILSIGSITRTSTGVCRLIRWNIVNVVERGGLRWD